MTPELTAAQTRILQALVCVYETQGRAEVRDVAAVAGRGVMTTHTHLRTLRRLRFVAWEDHRRRTLRPLLRSVPFGVGR